MRKTAVLGLSLLLSLPAMADIVILKSGGKIEGIAKRDGDRVVVETANGTVSVPASEVVMIDTSKKVPIQEYYEKLEGLKASGNAKDFLELAAWACEHKITKNIPYLMERAAPLVKNAPELLSLMDYLRLNGLAGEAYALVRRGPELAKDWDNVKGLVTLAALAKGFDAENVVRPLVTRILDLTSNTKEPHELLSTASAAKKQGLMPELEALIGRAAAACSSMPVKDILGVVDHLKSAELGEYRERFYRKILEADPENEFARREMGYVRHQGKWLTKDEWHVAQGDVRYQGDWMSPAERDVQIKERLARVEERLNELEQDRRKLEEERRKLNDDQLSWNRQREEEKRKLDDRQRDLDSRERQIADREAKFRDYRLCNSCNVWYAGSHICIKSYNYCSGCNTYYTGTHICSQTWTYCSGCVGYFRQGHACHK
jgi:hypothetical protein